MGNKRKQDSDAEDVDVGASDSDAPSRTTKPKQTATAAKAAPAKAKTAKKPKFGESKGEPSSAVERTTIQVLKSAEGEKYIDLGKKRRATVRSFKGQAYIDIREFYGADDDGKPGKKGISLTMEQWEVLKHGSSTIDSLFAELSGKK